MQTTPPQATNARGEVANSRLHPRRNRGISRGRELSLGGKSPYRSETGLEGLGSCYACFIINYTLDSFVARFATACLCASGALHVVERVLFLLACFAVSDWVMVFYLGI